MIRRILMGIFVAVLVILFLLWILGGGYTKTKTSVSRFPNVWAYFSGITDSTLNGGIFHSPWDVNLPQVSDTGDASSTTQVQDQQSNATETSGPVPDTPSQ